MYQEIYNTVNLFIVAFWLFTLFCYRIASLYQFKFTIMLGTSVIKPNSILSTLFSDFLRNPWNMLVTWYYIPIAFLGILLLDNILSTYNFPKFVKHFISTIESRL